MFFIISSLYYHNFNIYKNWNLGPSEALNVSSRYLFIGSGSRVIIFDFNYDTLTSISFNDCVKDIKIYNDSLMFVCSDNEGIYKVNISNIFSPIILDSLKLMGSSSAFFLTDSNIFVACGDNGVYIIDYNFGIIDSFDTPGFANSIYVKDSLLFVANMWSGIQILKIGDSIIPIGDYDTPGIAYSITLLDSFLYIGDYTNGILILNIIDPVHPILVKQITTDGPVQYLKIKNNVLYAAVSNFLALYNLDNPANPVKISNTNSACYKFDVEDTILITSSYFFGVDFYSISNINNPLLLYSLKTPLSPYDFSSIDSLLFLACGYYGVELFCNNNPLISYSTPSFTSGINFSNNFLFIANRWGGFLSVNFSDLYNPFLSDQIDLSGNEYKLKIKENYAYVASISGGLRIVDISDPYNLFEKGYYLSTNAYDVDVCDSISAIARYDYGVDIVNIKNKLSPHLITTIPCYRYVESCVIFDNKLFFTDADSGVQIYDISNPENPSYINRIRGLNANDIYILGHFIYISSTYDGVKVFDIFNPSNPKYYGDFVLYDKNISVYAYPPFLFAGTEKIGLWILTPDSSDIMPIYIKKIFVNNKEFPVWSNKDSMKISFLLSDNDPKKVFLKYCKEPFNLNDTNLSFLFSETISISPRFEGIDTLYFWFEDTMGNVDYRLNKYCVIKYDTTKPSSSSLLSPYDSEFINMDKVFLWTHSFDALSGVKNYIIQFDTLPSFSEPFLSEEVSDTFWSNLNLIIPNRWIFWRVLGVDSAGNISEPSQIYSFYLDNIPPYTPESIKVDGIPFISQWKKDSIFNISFYANDISGISKVLIKEGSPPISNFDTTSSFNNFPFDYIYNGEGIESVWVWLVDGAGNTDFNNSSFFILRRDTTPPDTLLNLTLEPDKWTNKDTFFLRWQIPPDLSGIFKIFFKIDSSPQNNYDTTFSINPDTSLIYILPYDGIHRLFIWSLDSALNCDFTKNNFVQLKLDRIKPEPPSPISPPNNSFISVNPLLEWSIPYDSISGINNFILLLDTTLSFVEPILSETTFKESLFISNELPEGKFIYWEVFSVDSASNISEHSDIFSFYIDKIPPFAPESIFVDNLYKISKWKNDSIYNIMVKEAISQSKSDTSGISRILYKLGNHPSFNYDTSGSSLTNNFSLKFKKEGIESVWVWLVDGAGNTDFNNSSFCIIRRDTTPPDTLLFLSISPEEWSSNDTFIIKFKTPQDLSGLSYISMKMKEIPENAYDTNLTFSPVDSTIISFFEDGLVNIYFWSFDSAGNNNFNLYQKRKLKRDTSVPLFNRIVYNDSLNENDTIFISLDISDSISGIKDAFLEIKNYNLGQTFRRFIPISSPNSFVLPYEYESNSRISLKLYDYAMNRNSFELNFKIYKNNIILRDTMGNKILFPSNRWIIVSSPIISGLRLSDNFSYLGEIGKDYLLGKVKDTIFIGRNSSDFVDSLKFGEGVFLKTLSGNAYIKFSNGFIDNTKEVYYMQVKKGWNIFGNPFLFTLKRNQILKDGKVLNHLWGFEEDWKLYDSIKPFTGALIYSEEDDTIFIYPDKTFEIEDILKIPYLNIQFYNDSIKDNSNYLILSKIDKTLWVREPPFLTSIVSFNVDGSRYAIVSLDTTPINIFKLELKEKGNLLFNIVGEFKDDIYVINKDNLYHINDFLSLRDIEDEFSIIIGDSSEIAEHIGRKIYFKGKTIYNSEIDFSLILKKDEEVKIFIYDLAGRNIYRYEGILSKGFNNINTGISHNGVYFLKVLCGDEKISKKMILIR